MKLSRAGAASGKGPPAAAAPKCKPREGCAALAVPASARPGRRQLAPRQPPSCAVRVLEATIQPESPRHEASCTFLPVVRGCREKTSSLCLIRDLECPVRFPADFQLEQESLSVLARALLCCALLQLQHTPRNLSPPPSPYRNAHTERPNRHSDPSFF